MRTDDLINILSQSPQSRKPLPFKWALALVFALCAVVTICVLGFRDDLAHISDNLTALHKTVLLLSALFFSGWMLKNSSSPIMFDNGKRILCGWLLLGLFGGSLIFEWVLTPAREITDLFLLPNFKVCLIAVTIYGATGSFFLTWLMKFYAPADGNKASFAIGLAAACAGAMGYSLHCPVDSPTFVTISYGLPILSIASVARFIVPRFIKW